jgi:UDPglucose--hexose-1-phosphate uridylyltransferase
MDFKFIENELSKKWTIFSPRRAKRPGEDSAQIPVCPFCVGREDKEVEAYRIPARHASQGDAGGGEKDKDTNWKVRVIPNKFPFAPIHEIVIHSQDHHKNFDELPLEQNQLILQTFRQRFQTHKDKGQVVIFHNHGKPSGESQQHPHSQIVVMPDFVKLDVPLLGSFEGLETHETQEFVIFAPVSSEWPDEVWVAPKKNGDYFGGSTDEQLADLARILYRLIQIFDLRHGHEFPFNFYISPHQSWYLRIIPRLKIIGGFEFATNMMVNTQDPKETIDFIKEHFDSPNEEKIRTEHQAKYHRAV